MTNLTTYIPEVRHPMIGGKNVTVAPLKVRQIPAFTRAITPVMGLLTGGNLLAAVASAGDDLIQAVSIATDEPATWIGDLEADEFLQLAAKVLEVNADFFVHRVAPAMTNASQTLTRILGETGSLSSSAPDLAGPASST